MQLELSVVSFHRLSPRLLSVFVFKEQGGLIGRSPECNWQLADPERFISGAHVRVGHDSEGFYVEDLSTNGLFYKSPDNLVGKGNRQYIACNDTLYLGDYELKVTSLDHAELSDSRAAKLEEADMAHVQGDSSLNRKPNDEASLAMSSSDEFQAERLVAPHPLNGSSFNGSAMESPIDDYFNVQPIIPDDWATDMVEHAAPDSSAGPPSQSNDEPSDAPDERLNAFVRGLGLGDDQVAQLSDSKNGWEQLGESLRVSLEGLITTIRARSEVKSELRVNQTTFQARENNPLKFSATFDDAFSTMFVSSSGGFLSPSEAIKSAYQDMSSHELALVDASGAMVESLVTRLSPENVKSKDVRSGILDGVSSLRTKARYWSLYELYHKELVDQYSRVQGRPYSAEFIESYEQSIQAKREGQGVKR